MLNTILRYFTPFVICIINIANGICLYRQYILDIEEYNYLYKIFSHTCGSSILVIMYILAMSKHMCIYYKSACYLLMFMHILSIIYTFTQISLVTYLYFIWIICILSFVLLTVSVLGLKTAKLIRQSYKRLQK